MELHDAERSPEGEAWGGSQVQRVIAMVSGETASGIERRRAPRGLYRTTAILQPVRKDTGEARIIHIRDANEWAVGFICDHEVPIGAEATLSINSPGRMLLCLSGYVARCRHVADGWHDAAFVFYGRQPLLSVEEIEREQRQRSGTA